MNQKRARDIAGFVLGLVLVLIGIALWEKEPEEY